MSLELHIDRKVGEAWWTESYDSSAWGGDASPAPTLNAYQSAADIIVAHSGDDFTDEGPFVDGTTYAYRCRIYDTVALTWTAYSNESAVVFSKVLVAIERKAGAGAYAEVTVQRYAVGEWFDPGPFVDETLYTYQARTYDCDEAEYSDYSDEDSVTYAEPGAGLAYYYASLMRE